ncbi:hypothetical protein [Massilia rubra]|uniref:Uncharacterized protein n=1 Tax=Massilia rubra TaxID=2607910 RepID=A0ABX0LMK1_9BURK|nr:hypothetical protein [Massilia rubra]NHZ36073.1 hypothetical protein [Massilia rubra]
MRHWYANLDKKNVFATGVGLVTLCGLIVALILTFLPEPEHIVGTSVFCCALTVPIALYYWIGKGAVELGIDSWTDWLWLSLGFLLLFILFMAIDYGLYNFSNKEIVPDQSGFVIGLSTFVVLGMALMALPGALRVWLLQR